MAVDSWKDFIETGIWHWDERPGASVNISYKADNGEKHSMMLQVKVEKGTNIYEASIEVIKNNCIWPKEKIEAFFYLQNGSGQFRDTYGFSIKYEDDKWLCYNTREVKQIQTIRLFEQ